MINSKCEILLQGKGFCWCPSAAWGVSDEQLCQLCKVKNAKSKKKIEFVMLEDPAIFEIKNQKEPQFKVAAST